VTMTRFLDWLDQRRFLIWLNNLQPESKVGLSLLLALALVGIMFALGWRGDA
jgi:hypothetical protein